MNQEGLAVKAAQGDRVAFGHLYDAHVNELYKFVYYKTHHKQSAEDLTADIFMKALEHMGSFDPSKAGFRTWLYTIARRTIIDHYRKQKPSTSIEDAWDLPYDTDVVSDLHTQLDVEQLKKYMHVLSAEQRDILMLRLWEDMSFKEVAEVLGKTEGSCKMAYSRALKTLRRHMPVTLFLLIILTKTHL